MSGKLKGSRHAGQAQNYAFKTKGGGKVVISYPCVMLNADVHENYTNHQYQDLVPDPNAKVVRFRSLLKQDKPADMDIDQWINGFTRRSKDVSNDKLAVLSKDYDLDTYVLRDLSIQAEKRGAQRDHGHGHRALQERQ